MASRRIQLRASKCQFPWTQLINIVNHDAAQNISMLHSPNPFQRCNKSFCWNLLSNELLQLFRFSFDIYYKKAINMKKWMVIWFSNRDYCSRLIEKTKTRVGFFCCLEDTCGRNLNAAPPISVKHNVRLCISATWNIFMHFEFEWQSAHTRQKTKLVICTQKFTFNSNE